MVMTGPIEAHTCLEQKLKMGVLQGSILAVRRVWSG